MENTKANTKRKYKRERRFDSAVTVSISQAMRTDLERLADADNLGLAAVLRRCLDAGLPRVKEASRKRRTRTGTAARQ